MRREPHTADWLAADESRIGMGCMRLSTQRDRDEASALAAIHAALDAGTTVFDTARAYALDDSERGHNERLLARALASHPLGARARVVTKCGMARPGGAWRADGRARSLAADCEESLRALGGKPIDLLLLHAPDPRVPFATGVRALAALVERGWVRRIGVCNVNRGQLQEALDLAPLTAVEVALHAAGAARPCPGSCSTSRVGTTSIRRDWSWSAPARRIRSSPPPWQRASCRPLERRIFGRRPASKAIPGGTRSCPKRCLPPVLPASRRSSPSSPSM